MKVGILLILCLTFVLSHPHGEYEYIATKHFSEREADHEISFKASENDEIRNYLKKIYGVELRERALKLEDYVNKTSGKLSSSIHKYGTFMSADVLIDEVLHVIQTNGVELSLSKFIKITQPNNKDIGFLEDTETSII
jgi:hypothetical protein